MMPDRQLVELSLTGEPIAYDVLAQRYRKRVEAVAAQFLRGADRNDCVQETLLKALINLHKLREPEKFGSWVCVIARNYCFDYLKKSGIVSSLDDDHPNAVLPRQFASRYPAPLAEIIRREENIRLRAGMGLLNEKYRTILDLRYMQDCDYATISLKLKKPLGTVKSLIHRAHNQLRRLMTDGSIQEGGAMVN